VQFAPGTPLPRAVFLDQPLARPTQLQPRTVDQQVDRATGGAGLCRQFQRPGPPAEGGEVRHRQVEAEQLEDRADQPWRSARWNTARSVRAVVIARSE
jgi:hypothetical protein